LARKLEHNVAADLDKNRQVIQQMIEQSIVAAYYYQSGAIEAGLCYDKQMREAERLLKSPEKYLQVLWPPKAQ